MEPAKGPHGYERYAPRLRFDQLRPAPPQSPFLPRCSPGLPWSGEIFANKLHAGIEPGGAADPQRPKSAPVQVAVAVALDKDDLASD